MKRLYNCDVTKFGKPINTIKAQVMDELTPIVQEFLSQPIAFLGGFTSGLLRLSLEDDPLRSWLKQQGISSSASNSTGTGSQAKPSGPQSISID
jgi:hypothetical protein